MDMDEQVTAAATTVAASATVPRDPVRLVTIPAAAQLLGVSRSKLYELLGEGALPTVRIGRSRRIAIADLDAFVQRCRGLS
jgi:excisionase family DNA binding protein